MKTRLATVLVLLLLPLLDGCANQQPTTSTSSAPMLNNVCLVSGESLDANCPTADFMGGKVGFCCDKCLAKWNGMDEPAKQAAFTAKK